VAVRRAPPDDRSRRAAPLHLPHRRRGRGRLLGRWPDRPDPPRRGSTGRRRSPGHGTVETSESRCRGWCAGGSTPVRARRRRRRPPRRRRTRCGP
jgi:hypothetical protein